MSYIEWYPDYNGHSPDLADLSNVQYRRGGEWHGTSNPRWFLSDEYRFPAEDLRGHNGGTSVEDAFEVETAMKGHTADMLSEYNNCQEIMFFGEDGDTRGSLPDDPELRNSFPMFDGLLAYFPNALAMVSKLSFDATQQHHPDKEMHWDREKSTDHENKIIRHLIDSDTVDDKGNDHWAMVCWRALAGYQTYLEKKHGYPMSRASRSNTVS